MKKYIFSLHYSKTGSIGVTIIADSTENAWRQITNTVFNALVMMEELIGIELTNIKPIA